MCSAGEYSFKFELECPCPCLCPGPSNNAPKHESTEFSHPNMYNVGEIALMDYKSNCVSGHI
jgi:hypothetical protein